MSATMNTGQSVWRAAETVMRLIATTIASAHQANNKSYTPFTPSKAGTLIQARSTANQTTPDTTDSAMPIAPTVVPTCSKYRSSPSTRVTRCPASNASGTHSSCDASACGLNTAPDPESTKDHAPLSPSNASATTTKCVESTEDLNAPECRNKPRFRPL